MKATPTYICVPVYKELTKNISENILNSALTINKEITKDYSTIYKLCTAKIASLASRFSVKSK